MQVFTLRAATEDDFLAIRQLIHLVNINPMSLDWRRFVVAVDPWGQLLGCGQLKPHAGGVVELASIAVAPARRRQGIASAIIDDLLAKASRPLYLTCRSGLGSFYERWGFRAIDLQHMPAYFRRLARIVGALSILVRDNESLLVMELM